MPRKKKEEVVEEKTKVVRRKKVVDVVAEIQPVGKPIEMKVEVPKFPMYNNLQVLKVLEDRHNATHFHCEMESGVRMHVPRKLFS